VTPAEAESRALSAACSSSNCMTAITHKSSIIDNA
jgi:hypothetical protein